MRANIGMAGTAGLIRVMRGVLLDELQKRGELAAIEAIKRVSPIAWQHINFYGHYQFDADFSPIDLAAIRQYLSSEEVLRFYAA